jgi:hypothetical protein
VDTPDLFVALLYEVRTGLAALLHNLHYAILALPPAPTEDNFAHAQQAYAASRS